MAASRSRTLFEFWSGREEEWGLERPPAAGDEVVDELEAAVREPGLERLAVSRAGGGCSIAAVVAAEGKRTAGSRLTEGMDSSRVEGRNFRPSWSSEVFTPGWEASRAVWKKEFAI